VKILFALPGLHAVSRGAEISFINIATGLCRRGHDVTLIGSGEPRAGVPYRYLRAPLISRTRFEHFPRIPVLRGDTAWEEASFLPGFLRQYRPQDYDATLTCSYPFLNWALRGRKHRGRRPAHVFVTQNGDWPARATNSEYRLFGCDGLVCINPDYFEANKGRYRSALIPNGVDLQHFRPGSATRAAFGLPEDVPIVLMVSALIESKFVGTGIDAVSRLPDVHLVVAGDGPLRDELREQADRLMPGRYHNLLVTPDRMPDLYRSASIFLHLSRDESFGNVFIEAMACGLPTVAWDLPRTRWITGEGACLVAGDDAVAIADGLALALRSDFSIAELRSRSERFSWDLISGDYEKFLTTLTSKQHPESRTSR
jgi:glycosyltransferase involved in cell wall biosynthesis